MLHRKWSVPLIVATTAVMLGGVMAATRASAAPPLKQDAASALPPAQPAAPANGGVFTLTILHTNDVHAHVDQYQNSGAYCQITGTGCIAGMARLKTIIDQVRAVNPNVLLLDAGDQFQGTLYYNVYKSDILTRTANALGYDAMAVGNHEFDDGPAELRRFATGVRFPVLSANLDVSNEPLLAGLIKPSTVVTVGGVPIGILGLTTEELSTLANPGNKIIVTAVQTAAQAEVNRLQAQGVNHIIALTHVGYNVDLELGSAITGIDVIIGGHSHTFLYTPVTPTNGDIPAGPYPALVTAPDGKPVIVATAYQWGRYLGNLNVIFEPTGVITSYASAPIFMANAIPRDPVMEAIISPTYNTTIDALRRTTVGTTTAAMNLADGSTLLCREGECKLGNFVAEATLWEANLSQPITRQYHIALHNGGLLRVPIAEGRVSIGEIMELLPFGNTLATFELTGTHIISALESGLSRFRQSGNGRFPQVAGLRYLWDPYKPAGSRLWRVEVRNGLGAYEPISPTALYRMVTNNYARSGGDGYTVFQSGLNAYDFGPQLDQSVIDYLGALSPYTPFLDGRIQQVKRWLMPIVMK